MTSDMEIKAQIIAGSNPNNEVGELTDPELRVIAEHSRELIVVLDHQMRFTHASASFERVLNCNPDELRTLNFLDFVHPGDIDGFRKLWDQALVFPGAVSGELRLRDRQDNYQPFESTVHAVEPGAAKPGIRVVVICRGIAERKRAETEILKLAAFPRLNPNPILEFSGKGELVYFNGAAMAMAKVLQKAHPMEILPVETSHTIQVCLATGQSKLHIRNTVAGRTLAWSFFPLPDHQSVHCYAEDITESLNLETQLRQMQKMESVGQLAAGVAHDFNNVLTVVQGHAGLILNSQEISPTIRESARQILAAAERAGNFTRQLLLFSRKQVLQPQLLNINDVITDILKMLRSLIGESVVLRHVTGGDLPPVYADVGMLEQVLVNLTVNARDAMPKGGSLTIQTFGAEIDESYVQRVADASSGRFVCMSVSDTGHGIEPVNLRRIFEPFFTTKAAGKGTGLGLSTVYAVVKQHRGWVEVESEVGQGTVFRVFLPASTKAPFDTEFFRRKEAPGGHETVLVVEDEEPLRELVREILESKGYRVLEAASGAKALQLWRQHREKIDLLMTDLMMPEGVSGRELAQATLAEKPNLKVLYTSGYSIESVSPGFTLEPGMHFLQKPYPPETLAQTIRDCLDN